MRARPPLAQRRQGGVSVQAMQRIDEMAIDVFGIPRLLLMEHAGLAAACAARMLLADHPSSRSRARGRGAPHGILVYCGSGYNGGDGMCAARHLLRWGERPRVILAGLVQQLNAEPAVYARMLHALDVPITEVTASQHVKAAERWLAGCDLIIDALLGIGLQGSVRPLQASLITQMNHADTPIVSVDVPSGLNADTGLPQALAVRATQTVTFGLPKQGFFRAQGPRHVGTLLVDEIGIPQRLLSRSGRAAGLARVRR